MNQHITIGEITNTHGHKGELKVLPLTDFPERFVEGKKVILNVENKNSEHQIESVRSHKNFLIIKFREIIDMNAAIGFKGALIQVPKEELIDLPVDHFYIFDIIGLEVFTIDGQKLGQVSNVIQTGSNDVYVVTREGMKDLLLPAIKDVVHDINLNEKKMTIKLIEGLEP